MKTMLAGVLIALMSLATVAQADTLDDIKKAGKVRIAIDTAIPPFGMTDDKMQPAGSDVETVVHLYEEHGERLAEHLTGMFAFCVLDWRDAQRPNLRAGQDTASQPGDHGLGTPAKLDSRLAREHFLQGGHGKLAELFQLLGGVRTLGEVVAVELADQLVQLARVRQGGGLDALGKVRYRQPG